MNKYLYVNINKTYYTLTLSLNNYMKNKICYIKRNKSFLFHLIFFLPPWEPTTEHLTEISRICSFSN